MTRYIEELVCRQVRQSELARQRAAESGEPCAHSVVTISRRMGSGARIVAQKLAEELGWSLWDKELIDAIAQDADVSRRVVEAFDEKTMSELEVFARGALGDHEMGGFLYPRHLARAVASIAALGNAIILGRGANYILPDALHVRIDASFEFRVANMMRFEGLTREQAIAKINESDRERAAFLVRVFGKERVQNTHYDLAIHMDRFTNDEAVRILRTAVDIFCHPAGQPCTRRQAAS